LYGYNSLKFVDSISSATFNINYIEKWEKALDENKKRHERLCNQQRETGFAKSILAKK
jgi:hypothetical protein